jgi:hypothetical protein
LFPCLRCVPSSHRTGTAVVPVAGHRRVSLSPSLARSRPAFAPLCVLRSPSWCDWASTRASLSRNPSPSCPLPSSHLVT